MRPAAAVLAATLALTGCQGGDPKPPKTAVETRFLDELSDAIEDLNAARKRLADDANAIGASAAALDDVDDVAITGSRDLTRGRRPAADKAMAKAAPAARRLNKDIAAYRTALTALQTAPKEGLDHPQQAALGTVVTAVRAELARLRTYATVVASVWPRYEKVNDNQKLWLLRSNGGWYRDQQEAAGAYAVLNDRAALARDRTSLASADAKRLAAAKTASAAIGEARGALASLLG